MPFKQYVCAECGAPAWNLRTRDRRPLCPTHVSADLRAVAIAGGAVCATCGRLTRADALFRCTCAGVASDGGGHRP